MHDHFLPYRRMDKVEHAFCNAHILRELQALIEFDKEPWAELMRDVLSDAKAADRGGARGRRYDAHARDPRGLRRAILGRGADGLGLPSPLPKLETKSNSRGRPKQRPGHNLLDRLKTFKTETLRFMTDFEVPFTNNLAEQDLRMMKVRMKISGSSEPSRALKSSPPSDPSSRPPESKAKTSSKS